MGCCSFVKLNNLDICNDGTLSAHNEPIDASQETSGRMERGPIQQSFEESDAHKMRY